MKTVEEIISLIQPLPRERELVETWVKATLDNDEAFFDIRTPEEIQRSFRMWQRMLNAPRISPAAVQALLCGGIDYSVIDRHHLQLAQSCWRLIKSLGGEDNEEYDKVAVQLIEMACDSAAESARVALGHKPRGVK